MRKGILIRTHLLKTVALLFAGALLTFCGATKSQAQENAMKWMETPASFCIGRFQLLMPNTLKSKWEKYIYNADNIETLPGLSINRFKEIVAKRERELLANKREDITRGILRKTSIPWLEKAISPDSDSRLLIFQEASSQDIAGGFVTEGYVWRDGTVFVLKSSADEDKVAVAIADDSDKIGRIKARNNRAVPTEPGFCFDGGIMTGGTKFYETATAYYERPSTPGGVIFGIEMRPNVPSDDKLLDRVPKLMQMMGDLTSHTQTLRQSERPLAGLDGQEMLTKISVGGITAYYFIWEAKGEPASVLHPNTHIELRIGGEENMQTYKRESAVLNEEDALTLWDQILQSFRLRPNAV